MLLVVAALKEELKAALALCRDSNRICWAGANLWEAKRHGESIFLLKSGYGPRRSAASLARVLTVINPERILVIGYAGGLDPELKLGHIVGVKRALALSFDKDKPGWNHVRVVDDFELTDGEAIAQCAAYAGFGASIGDVLTSARVLGEPTAKAFLFQKFHASIVDMETAALARVAFEKSIPLSCVRVISDEAQDTFLVPFSYESLGGIFRRTKGLMDVGMIQAFREWKRHAAVANQTLSRFLSHYL